MCCIGKSLLCVTAGTDVCCSVICLCRVPKLRVPCDKGEGLRYVNWKVTYRRWTGVLKLEWSVLQ